MSSQYFVHIVAMDENNAIGLNDQLLFRVKEDMQQFARLTKGHRVVAGTKTLKALPALKDRRIYQMSRDTTSEPLHPAVKRIGDLNLFFNMEGGRRGSPTFIIGGGEIYAETLGKASVLMITRFHTKVKEADTHYPDFLNIGPRPTYYASSETKLDEVSGIEYSFHVYGYDSNHTRMFLNMKAERSRDEIRIKST